MLKSPDFLPAALLTASRRVELPAGQYLFRCGEMVERLHWIVRGELLAVRPTPSGQEAVITRGRAGEFFAEASLFTPKYTCEAVARKPSILLCIPAQELRSTLASNPEFSELLLRSTVMALRRQCSRIERLRIHGAADRIEHFLSCETASDGWSQLGMPLSEWAIDLGLEPATLYRTLRTLENSGKLLRDGHRMRLVQPIKDD